MQKIMIFLFGILFFFTPLIFWPYTSEVFELNKIVFVYGITTIIGSVWIVRSIIERKIIFRRTILDIPLLVFIASQILSTIFSIDPRTSFLGYYSRFNGGLLSTLTYCLLYWAYVSNMDAKAVIKHMYVLFASTALSAGAAVLEHFGIFLTCGTIGKITVNCWVQDVQLRVFSTFGQPNWLATWLVALLPLAWTSAITNFQLPISNQFSKYKFPIFISLTVLFFATLLFTGSRSGMLGLAVGFLIYWVLNYSISKKETLKPFIVIGSSLLVLSLIFGTPFTPSLVQMFSKQPTVNSQQQATGPALETGGTESGTIRKIVWKGAIDVWKHYPITGSGLETFAFSYYGFRPAEHNLVSEWDFIYNKAHNEYLNFMANSGTLGILAYLGLIIFSVLQISNFQFPITNKFINLKIENFGFLAGYSGILVTNFFGFSVVPTQLLFFLFPAFAGVLAVQSTKYEVQSKKLEMSQKVFVFLVLCTMYYVLSTIFKFWLSDLNYAKGKAYDSAGKFTDGIKYLTKAIAENPKEPLYLVEIAQSHTLAAIDAITKKDNDGAQKYLNLAVSEIQKAVSLSPANVNIRRSMFGVYIRLSTLNPQFLTLAKQTLEDAVKLAPTDAKIIYNLGLAQARLNEADAALASFEKAISVKSNYKEARLARALILIDKKNYKDARAELNYILERLDPNDSITKSTLEEIRNQ